MGKLIVIEGSDGSGKATQTRKLYERLRDLEVNVQRVTFPNYESESSALITMYLRGDFGGSAEAVNPYAAATFYAVDRFAGYKDWKNFYEQGGIVLSDRYVGSNMAYQAAKFKKKSERNKFWTWLEDLEFERFKLPRPDLTIFLDMPEKNAVAKTFTRTTPIICAKLTTLTRKSLKNSAGRSLIAPTKILPAVQWTFTKIFCRSSKSC